MIEQLRNRLAGFFMVATFLMLFAFSFLVGWYSGSNHQILKWRLKYSECQVDLERERVNNQYVAKILDDMPPCR